MLISSLPHRADDPAAHQEPLFYLFLDLPSFGVLGWAAVTDLDPHPQIRPVPSPQTRPPARLVTGRFESIARELLDVTIVTDRGETEVIETTPSHPFYSADRRDYIPAAQLRLDERLRTADDPPGHASARVKSLVPRAPPQGEPGFRVYNLEVHGLHTYHVGDAGVLVHNTCSPKPGEALYVGTYDTARRGIIRAGLSKLLTPHHVVQSLVSNIRTYGRQYTITLPDRLHRMTRTFRRSNTDLGSLRRNLAADIKDVKSLLTTHGFDRRLVNQQLRELIRLNLQ